MPAIAANIRVDLCRILLEKGVELSLEEDGNWYGQPESQYSVQMTDTIMDLLESLKSAYSVRPVLVNGKIEGKEGDPLLLGCDGERLGFAWNVDLGFEFFDQIFNVLYVVRAVEYHCIQLAEAYRRVARIASRLPPSEWRGSVFLVGQYGPYYEFDSLITTARRAYDTLRYLLWKKFGPRKGSIPRNFEGTISRCEGLPNEVRTRLETSWSTWGKTITEYRDCILHYSPVGYGSSNVLMSPLTRNLFSISLFIPDNPSVRSMRNFTYKSRIDALSYGWRVAEEILSLGRFVAAAAAAPAS